MAGYMETIDLDKKVDEKYQDQRSSTSFIPRVRRTGGFRNRQFPDQEFQHGFGNRRRFYRDREEGRNFRYRNQNDQRSNRGEYEDQRREYREEGRRDQFEGSRPSQFVQPEARGQPTNDTLTKSPKPNVIIKGLGAFITDQKLRDLCQGYGPMDMCKLDRDSFGNIKPQGIALIKYERIQDARKVVEELNGAKIVEDQDRQQSGGQISVKLVEDLIEEEPSPLQIEFKPRRSRYDYDYEPRGRFRRFRGSRFSRGRF